MSATAEAPADQPATGAKGFVLPPWWEKALFPLFVLIAIVWTAAVAGDDDEGVDGLAGPKVGDADDVGLVLDRPRAQQHLMQPGARHRDGRLRGAGPDLREGQPQRLLPLVDDQGLEHRPEGPHDLRMARRYRGRGEASGGERSTRCAAS